MRIKFRVTQLYESLGRNQGPLFTAGEVYDFTEDFGRRWTERDVADPIPGGEDAVLVGRDGPFVPVVFEEAPVSEDAPPPPPAKIKGAAKPSDAPAVPAFPAGAIVRLKSGSPDLTVAVDQPDPTVIAVTWLNDDQTPGAGAFPAASLELAPAV